MHYLYIKELNLRVIAIINFIHIHNNKNNPTQTFVACFQTLQAVSKTFLYILQSLITPTHNSIITKLKMHFTFSVQIWKFRRNIPGEKNKFLPHKNDQNKDENRSSNNSNIITSLYFQDTTGRLN